MNQLIQNLKIAKSASRNGVIKSADLARGVKEYLIKNSYLTEIIRGWYLLTTPAGMGTTTLWYSCFWEFISYYLQDRFGENGYCLSAETSVDIHMAKHTIPKQVIVVTKKSSNQTIDLLHGSS